MATYLCIDIGGTRLKAALADEDGKLSHRQQMETPQNKQAFLNQLTELVRQQRDHLAGVAIAVPGTVDRQEQTLHFGGMLPFLDGVNFPAVLGNFGIPVSVENDGKAAALAELWQGSLQDVTNGATIILGTAVGGGIIVNHQLLHGTHSQAGEFSFMMDHFYHAGNDKMVAHNCSAVELVHKMNIILGNKDVGNGKKAFKAVRQGNQDALALLHQYGLNVAQLILNIQTIIDGQKVAIGGGISAQPLLIKAINEAYDQLIADPPIIQQTLTRPIIVSTTFHNDANLLGALYGLKERMR